MSINKIYTVYFSPTGGTEKIAVALASKMSDILHIPAKNIDLTVPANRQKHYVFDNDSLVILAVPVYAGRIPNKLLPDLERCIDGNGKTAVIPVSVYGNRSYDEALRELLLLTEKHGFIPVSAAAMVSRHVFSDIIAKDRPDSSDLALLSDLAAKTAEKLSSDRKLTAIEYDRDTPVGPYYTPLKADNTPARFLKAKPVIDVSKCIKCGSCIQKCPVGSISCDDVSNTPNISGICIKCQACIISCPSHAIYFTDEEFLSHVEMLEKTYTARKEPEFFL